MPPEFFKRLNPARTRAFVTRECEISATRRGSPRADGWVLGLSLSSFVLSPPVAQRSLRHLERRGSRRSRLISATVSD